MLSINSAQNVSLSKSIRFVKLGKWYCNGMHVELFTFLYPQIMKEVRRALCNASADDSKLLLLSAVGSVFCSGLDYSYLIGRLSNDRRKESTRIAEAIRWPKLTYDL